jgi:UPF0755 protein
MSPKKIIAHIREFFYDVTQFVVQFFATSDEIQEELSEKWRPHANRRTIIILLTGGTLALVMWVYVISPPVNFPLQQLVTVREGASVDEIAFDLEAAGVVSSALAFKTIAVLTGHARTLHAGDYLFKEPKDIFSVVRAVSLGAFGLEPEKIRIPEGATTRSMAIIYKSRLLRFDTAKFLAKAQPEEGFLFPDTYFFLPNADEDTVISTMRANFDEHMKPYEAEIASSTHSLHDIITLASIIEREASKSSDRHMISGVLYNRLAQNMALQVDVTFLYTMGKNTFQLTLADLRSDNPYNTYVHKGLPPGPIGSPSLDSIDAAIHPEKHKYIFYLADNTGVTHYSRTYEEHLAKKRLYLGS